VPVSAKARRKSERAGRLAEFVCSLHLRLRAYGILARNFRAPDGRDRHHRTPWGHDCLRRSQTTADALESFRSLQRRRIATTAELYLAAWPALAGLHARFDVMVVAP